MIRTLSKDFKVDLLATYIDEESLTQAEKAMVLTGGKYIPVKSSKHKGNLVRKRINQLNEYLSYYLFGIDKDVTANKRNNRPFLNIIRNGGYRIVISNYWESSLYFKNLGSDVYKILDPHYAVGENLSVLMRFKDNKIKYFFEKRRLGKNIKSESEVIKASDLLLPLSQRNLEEFLKISPDKTMLLIPDGADLDHYLSFPLNPEPETILFYGAMGSYQNKRAFWRLYEKILPELKIEFPGLRLLVVGAFPPFEIKEIHNGKDIIVTGFVEDVRPWLSKAWIKVIPLELGSGFRGRIVELLAMGIPVVGTHNALDSIGLTNKEHCFISDSDEDITSYCIKLIKNKELRNRISSKAKDFVKENYSLESTFGKLNKFLKSEDVNGSN
jgi:glycosyltransferase involved in cell wall biosynthesis